MSSSLDALYKNTVVNVWVEDDVTRAYLKAVWKEDADIGVLIAGGWTNVAGAVEESRQGGYGNVYGCRDRDFGDSNRAQWGDASLVLFKGDAFEVENLQLDEKAIEACEVNTAGKSAADILAAMHALATAQVWWMACRKVLDTVMRDTTKGFPEHPPRGEIVDQASAEKMILHDAWVLSVASTIPALVDPKTLRAALVSAHAIYDGDLKSGAWKQSFSGKEILHEIVTWFWTSRRPSKKDGLWVDLAKAVARAQLDQRTVPTEVTDLRAVLRAHVGLKA